MIAKSTRYAVYLGLAGSVAVAVVPAAHAQVQVQTGSNFTGQAAFFVPTPGGATSNSGRVELFDLSVQTLNLQTSSGNTSTAVFVPTAARFDAKSDNQPNAGDTGTVRGYLSGIAFSATGGSPIPFSQRDTIFNFTVNSFNSNLGTINGTLISPQTPGQASLLFLPNVNATVAPGSSFQATGGEMQLGDINAKLDSGAIDLPSTVRFQQTSSSTTTPPIATLDRRIKFEFEGENVVPENGTNFNVTTNNTGNNNNTGNTNNQLRFAGQTNKKIKIETVGNSGSGQYKLDGNVGAVDIEFSGPFSNLTTTGTLSNTASTTYKIQGESNGVLSLFALNSVGFDSTSQSNTQFDFRQGSNRLTGSSTGDVNFFAAAGVNSINRDTSFTNYQPSSSNNLSSGSNSTCTTLCGGQLTNTVVFGGTIISVGSPINVGTGSGSTGSGSTGSGSTGSGSTGSGSTGSGSTGSGSTGSGSTGSGSTGSGGSGSGGSSASGGSCGGGCSDNDANPVNTSVFGLGGSGYSSTARTQYQILASSNVRFVTKVKVSGGSSGNARIRVRVMQRGGDRYYVVYREGSGGSGNTGSGSGSSSGSSSGTGTATGTGTGSGTATGTGSGTGTGTATGTGSGTGTGTATGTGSGTGTGTATGTGTGSGSSTGTGTGSGSGTSTGTGTTTATGTNTGTGTGTSSGNCTGQNCSSDSDDDNQNQGQQGSSTTASGDDDDDDDDDDNQNQGQQGSSTTASGDDDDDDDNQNQGQQGSSTTASGDDDDDDDDDDDSGCTGQNCGSNNQVVYKVVGPSSRCFPGLAGLRQLSADEAVQVTNNNTNTSGNNTGSGVGTTNSSQSDDD
jgi:hypothetical protein